MDWFSGLSPDEWSALRLSLKVSLVAALATLPVALGLAFALARGRFRGKALLDGLVLLPLVLPPVVTGYVLLILLGRRGPIGAFLDQTFGLVFAFRWTGAALACAIMGLPLMVRTMRLAIEGVDRRLEAAAATLGANPVQTFFRITLPLIWPGMLAGFVLGFAKAMGEFGATITFVANIPGQTQTLPSAIYAYLQVPGGDEAAFRLVLVAIAIAMLALLLSEWVGRSVARRIAGA